MDTNTKIKFSRNGVEIGEYKLLQVEYELKLGTIKLTDHYWHVGMTGWSSVQMLVELIEKAKKEELGKAKNNEEIERAKREAKLEEQKRSNFFKCNCCRHTFEESEGVFSRFGKGTGIVILSSLISMYPLSFISERYISSGEKNLMVIFGFVSVLLWIIGCGFILSAFVRAPSCPGCGSSNFAKPEKPELSPKQ
jgi:hypothetical protein